MVLNPLIAMYSNVDVKFGQQAGVVLYLIGEILAVEVRLVQCRRKAGHKAHKEPKSTQGTLVMSSVSTPNDPSKVGPSRTQNVHGFLGIGLGGAYNFGQSWQ